MPEFKMTLSTSNAATGTPEEVAELLRKIAGQLDDGYEKTRSILDANGNRVGSWSASFPVTEEERKAAVELLAAEIESYREYAADGPITPGDRIVVIDGSAYAPSWRAFRALGDLWDKSCDGDVIDDINDDLTELESNQPEGWSLYWEDGCLWLEADEEN